MRVVSRVRRVQPLTEIRVPFEVSGAELETLGRGANDADLNDRLFDHTSTSVLLYLQETFTFRALTPEAAVPLTYARGGS